MSRAALSRSGSASRWGDWGDAGNDEFIRFIRQPFCLIFELKTLGPGGERDGRQALRRSSSALLAVYFIEWLFFGHK